MSLLYVGVKDEDNVKGINNERSMRLPRRLSVIQVIFIPKVKFRGN